MIASRDNFFFVRVVDNMLFVNEHNYHKIKFEKKINNNNINKIDFIELNDNCIDDLK